MPPCSRITSTFFAAGRGEFDEPCACIERHSGSDSPNTPAEPIWIARRRETDDAIEKNSLKSKVPFSTAYESISMETGTFNGCDVEQMNHIVHPNDLVHRINE